MAGGRPSKYETHIKPYLKEIQILNENGVPLERIAKIYGVADSTLRKHKREIEEFSTVYKKIVDGKVEKYEYALDDLALGRAKEVTETHVFTYDEQGNEILKEKRVVTKTLAPDKVAVFFGLTNKAPDKWSHKQELNLEVNDDIAPSFGSVLKEHYEKNNKQ